MNTWKSNGCNFQTGQRIVGKWHKQEYIVLKKIGQGATGTVYLVRSGPTKMAMKVSEDLSTITSEVNMLKELMQVQRRSLGPCLLDIDDSGLLHFYCMEYIEGYSLQEWLEKKGGEWLFVCLPSLLNGLYDLHELGYVFGDLKPENIMMSKIPPYEVRLIDPGGITKIGRSVKEYTEYYDRGYWGCGSRTSDVGYDIFAVAMIVIYSQTKRYIKRNARPKKQLLLEIETHPALIPYKEIVKKAVLGNYRHVLEMKRDFLLLYVRKEKQKKSSFSMKLFVSLCFCSIIYIMYGGW